MQTADQIYPEVVDLYWIAFLIISSADLAADAVLSELEKSSVSSLSRLKKLRRAVITGALTAVHDDLASSEVRMEHMQLVEPVLPSAEWSLDPTTNRSQVQRALLAIDVFPRCALLLTVFEGFKIDDAAHLLQADPELVIRGRIVGLVELTRNLASLQGWRNEPAITGERKRETQYA